MPSATMGQVILGRKGRRVVIDTGAVTISATWNPADKSANVTVSNGNLTATGAASFGNIRSTSSKATGKWHFEVTMPMTTAGSTTVGVGTAGMSYADLVGQLAGGFGYIPNAAGSVFDAGVGKTPAEAATSGTFAVELDADAQTIYFQRSGGSRFGPYAISFAGPYFVAGSVQSGDMTLNVGATAFAVTPTSGFSAWG